MNAVTEGKRAYLSAFLSQFQGWENHRVKYLRGRKSQATAQKRRPPVSRPIMDAGPHPGGQSEPALFTISRVNQVAKAVAERVRQAMTPEKFTPVRILVVTDNPDSADAMAAVLSQLGCPVQACYTAVTALATAGKFEPEVCVLDSMMPRMDGLELASRLQVQAAGRPIKLVATVGFEDWSLLSPAAMSAYHFLLIRPVDAATLMEMLIRLGQIVAPPDGSSTSPIGS